MKLTLGSQVTGMSGSVGGLVHRKWKGIQVCGFKPFRPRQPRTVEQMTVRQLMSHFASLWNTLTNQNKRLWEQYASLLAKPQSGENAYIGINSRGIYTGLIAEALTIPPSEVENFGVIQNFALSADATNLTFTWENLGGGSGKVIAEYGFKTYYNNQMSPRWRFAFLDAMGAGTHAFAHGMPTGTLLWGKLRPGRTTGAVGPWTEIKTATVPA